MPQTGPVDNVLMQIMPLTYRGLVESVFNRVKALLVAQGQPIYNEAVAAVLLV